MRFLICAVIFGISQVASAHVPPSGFLVRSMVKSRKEVRSVAVRAKLQVFRSGGEEAALLVQHDFRADGALLRTRISLSDGRALVAHEKKQDRVGLLLFSPDADAIVLMLKTAGVPIPTELEPAAEVQGIGRMNRRAFWVTGTEYPYRKNEQARPQIWIEKDSFNPARWILPMSASRHSTGEAIFEEHRTIQGLPYPQKIEWKLDETMVRESLESLIVNPGPKNPAAEMTSLAPGWTELGRDLPSSVRDAIQGYLQFR